MNLPDNYFDKHRLQQLRDYRSKQIGIFRDGGRKPQHGFRFMLLWCFCRTLFWRWYIHFQVFTSEHWLDAPLHGITRIYGYVYTPATGLQIIGSKSE